MDMTSPSLPSTGEAESRGEKLFSGLRGGLNPEKGVEKRIKYRVQTHMRAAAALRAAREAMRPDESVKESLWDRVTEQIEPTFPVTIFDRLRQVLTPPPEVQTYFKSRLLWRLEPVTIPVTHRRFKWVAAFALLLFVVRASPLLFLAPHSVADSPLILIPTRGESFVLTGEGVWMPILREMHFGKSVLVQTHDGEATLVLHDDAVVRLAPHTTLALHDTADRPAPAKHDPSLTLHSGQIWVQSLIPSRLDGLSIALSQGKLIVHEGSLSISEGDAVSVSVWDRRAHLALAEEIIPLVAGERVTVGEGSPALVKKIASEQYDETWAQQNLRRDAVHRREIAQWQHERRAALAGILPTSKLYAVKRAAEAVDVLLTFGEEARAQKRLDQASTRLNEAAALLAEGNTASVPLEEYRQTMIDVATGSGQGSLVQFLIEQELTQATADVAAVLPDDQAYILKKTVLETSAAVPDGITNIADVESILLVDTLSSLMRSIEEGSIESAKQTFAELKPHLAELEEAQVSSLSPEMKKEAKASLSTFAVALNAFQDEVGGIDEEFLAEVEDYLPRSTSIAVRALSDAEIDAVVQSIYNRIFLYKLARSRWNQLLVEFRALDGHPDQGRILRALYHELPENGLARYVRTEFERVKEAKAGGQEEL